MAVRTSPIAVREIIEAKASIDLLPFITAASNLVTWLDGKDTEGTLTSGQLEDIERWLAAHFYAHRDQLYQSRNSGKAGATFQGQTAMHLDSTQYGQTAMMLDVTGNLSRLNKQAKDGRHSANVIWLGTE